MKYSKQALSFPEQDDRLLAQRVRTGSRDAARLSFEEVAHDMLLELMDSNFRFYKKVQDDETISSALFDRLFERYCRAREKLEVAGAEGQRNAS